MSELKRVLAATDGCLNGASAVVTGDSLARRAGARFDVVSTVETEPLSQALHCGAATANEAVADEPAVDLIVVAAHHHFEIVRFVGSSTATRLVRRAHCPVLVACEPRAEPFRRILAAVDLSPVSSCVLAIAATLARLDGAVLRTLYVAEPFPPMLCDAAQLGVDGMLRYTRRELQRLISEARLPAGAQICERAGYAGREILEEARDRDCDLVVVGAHSFRFFNRPLLGSTSFHVMRRSRCTTLIVPCPERLSYMAA